MGKSKAVHATFEPFESTAKHPNRYVRFAFNMIDSKAWRELKPISVKLYQYLKLNYKNNPHKLDFIASYSHIKEHVGFCDASIKSAFDGLIKNGFIEIVENNRHRMKANIYMFSDNWHHYGKRYYSYNKELRKVLIDSSVNLPR